MKRLVIHNCLIALEPEMDRCLNPDSGIKNQFSSEWRLFAPGFSFLSAAAHLTMIALDMHSKPTDVPPIIPITEDEIRRNGEAIDRKKTRVLERIREEKHQKES